MSERKENQNNSATVTTPEATAETAVQNNMKTIVEGSAKMCYPATEESTVFYNPVQVQNRDLSILMITLFAERRALRLALQDKRKELKKSLQLQKKQGIHGNNNNNNSNNNNKELTQQLQEYQSTLTGPDCLKMQNVRERGLHVLDALAASGLRSIRYWKEVPGVRHLMVNDMDPAAVERARSNLQVNGLEDVVVVNSSSSSSSSSSNNNNDGTRPYGICVQQGDACAELYSSRKPNPGWDVVDLDPYGSAAPFLDAAVQGAANGALLCVTCTDMAALGGSHPETCYGRYAAQPIQRAGYLQELALRILLQSIATTAARYGRTIRPILSVGMNFYVRVFVEVKDDKAGVNKLGLMVGSVYQSTQCPSFHIAPSGQLGGKKGNVYQAGRPPLGRCEESGSGFKIGGPFWLGPLHDTDVIQEALKRLESSNNDSSFPAISLISTKDRLRGLLINCKEEVQDAPLYYKLPDLAQTLNISTPPLIQVKAALINAGYRASGYHKEPQAIKTDASASVVWDIMRAWCQKYPPKRKSKEGSTAEKILAVKPNIEVDFSIPKSLKQATTRNKDKVARFPMNPQPNWGPKPRASGHKRKLDDSGGGDGTKNGGVPAET